MPVVNPSGSRASEPAYPTMDTQGILSTIDLNYCYFILFTFRGPSSIHWVLIDHIHQSSRNKESGHTTGISMRGKLLVYIQILSKPFACHCGSRINVGLPACPEPTRRSAIRVRYLPMSKWRNLHGHGGCFIRLCLHSALFWDFLRFLRRTGL